MGFEVIAPPLEEPSEDTRNLGPAQQAESLAYFKARSVADLHPHCRVIGADTVVALGDKTLGKAKDKSEARWMLHSLSGTRHAVITGLALLGPHDERLLASEVTWIQMKPLSEQDVEAYVASGEWIGKAGAYAIQETAERFIELVDGSFTNVVGLPMELLERMFIELDYHPNAHKII